MSTLPQIRQVAHLRSTTCNLQGLSPTQRSTQTTPSRNLTLGVMQLATVRSPEPVGVKWLPPQAREPLQTIIPAGQKPRQGRQWKGGPRGRFCHDGSRRVPCCPAAPAAAVPAISLVPVASSWTSTSTHAAQTQAGTTRGSTQRHVGLAARTCTETSMHAAQTQARTQHKPP